MRILVVLLTTGIFVLLLAGAVLFYRATICRQKAWQSAFELKTRTLLDKPADLDQTFILSCNILVKRREETITWQTLPQLKKIPFTVKIKGDL